MYSEILEIRENSLYRTNCVFRLFTASAQMTFGLGGSAVACLFSVFIHLLRPLLLRIIYLLVYFVTFDQFVVRADVVYFTVGKNYYFVRLGN